MLLEEVIGKFYFIEPYVQTLKLNLTMPLIVEVCGVGRDSHRKQFL